MVEGGLGKNYRVTTLRENSHFFPLDIFSSDPGRPERKKKKESPTKLQQAPFLS